MASNEVTESPFSFNESEFSEKEFFESDFFNGESLADNVLLYAFKRTNPTTAADDIINGWIDSISFAYYYFEPMQFIDQLDLWYDIIFEGCQVVHKPDFISEYSERELNELAARLYHGFIDRILELDSKEEAEE